MNMDLEAELRLEVQDNPGSEAAVRLANELRDGGRHLEALDVLLASLSANPQNHQARLLLAKLFAERKYYEFALREVRDLLTTFPENDALRKLAERLSPGVANMEAETPDTTGGPRDSTLAEAEIEFEALEELEAEKKT
jgi:tetratricopeptide (TPR) repeat protein